MTVRAQLRDIEGRTYADFVADRVIDAVIRSGMSAREVAELCGIPRSTFSERLNNVRPFTTAELGCVGAALGVHPSSLTIGFEPVADG